MLQSACPEIAASLDDIHKTMVHQGEQTALTRRSIVDLHNTVAALSSGLLAVSANRANVERQVFWV